MTPSSSPRLAAADRLLLRSVLVWARSNRWRGWKPANGYKWDRIDSSDEVWWYYDADDRDRWTLVTNVVPAEACVTSVAQAVDVLVALGILPAQFSSAFAAGRESLPTESEWAMYSNPSGYVDHPTHRREAVEAEIARLWAGFDLVTRQVSPWVRASDGSLVNERRAGE